MQQTPEIAPGHGLLLAVWVDVRTSLTSIPTFTGGPNLVPNIGSMWDIYATRIDAAGNLIDPVPIIVSQQILNQGMPDVAWNGENWLVVWSGQQGMACCPKIHVYAARVSPEGVLLDDPPIVVDTDPTSNGLYWPCVASDETNWVVVWRDLNELTGIFTLDGARIAPDGTVLDPGGIRLRQDNYNSYPVSPDLAFSGDEFLLVWSEVSAAIRGQRLTPALDRIGGVFTINTYNPTAGTNPVDQGGTAGSPLLVRYDAIDAARGPVAAAAGDTALIVWEDNRNLPDGEDIYARRILPDGTLLDPSIGVPISTAPNPQYEPSVTWDGGQYVVEFGDTRNDDYIDQKRGDLYGTRVPSLGQPIDPEGLPS